MHQYQGVDYSYHTDQYKIMNQGLEDEAAERAGGPNPAETKPCQAFAQK